VSSIFVPPALLLPDKTLSAGGPRLGSATARHVLLCPARTCTLPLQPAVDAYGASGPSGLWVPASSGTDGGDATRSWALTWRDGTRATSLINLVHHVALAKQSSWRNQTSWGLRLPLPCFPRGDQSLTEVTVAGSYPMRRALEHTLVTYGRLFRQWRQQVRSTMYELLAGDSMGLCFQVLGIRTPKLRRVFWYKCTKKVECKILACYTHVISGNEALWLCHWSTFIGWLPPFNEKMNIYLCHLTNSHPPNSKGLYPRNRISPRL
jgi:hypothetical protein